VTYYKDAFMRKFALGFAVAMAMLCPRYGSYADDGPGGSGGLIPINNQSACFKLEGTQEGCTSINQVFPCSNPPPVAVLGAGCGSHLATYSSPKWDKLEPAGSAPGYHSDWSIEHTCAIIADCTVQPGALGPICAIDLQAIMYIKMTQVQLNFDDPCNFTP
jgi:hypothetical protein